MGSPVPGLKVKLIDIPLMDIVASRDNKGEVRLFLFIIAYLHHNLNLEELVHATSVFPD